MLKFFHLVLHARQIDFEPLQVLAIRLHLFVVDALLAVCLPCTIAIFQMSHFARKRMLRIKQCTKIFSMGCHIAFEDCDFSDHIGGLRFSKG